MLTALIRTHPGRELLLSRATATVYPFVFLVHHGQKVSDYSYNLYCNDLKKLVKGGYFFFLDSDDYVIDGAIARILPLLKQDHANIVQMLRNGKPKPRNESYIRRGYIGGPCLILHAKYALIADWTNTACGDWDWIRAMTEQLPVNFIPIPLVNAGKRSHGK